MNGMTAKRGRQMVKGEKLYIGDLTGLFWVAEAEVHDWVEKKYIRSHVKAGRVWFAEADVYAFGEAGAPRWGGTPGRGLYCAPVETPHLTVQDVAKKFGVSEPTVINWGKRGVLRAVNVFGKIRFYPGDVRHFALTSHRAKKAMERAERASRAVRWERHDDEGEDEG